MCCSKEPNKDSNLSGEILNVDETSMLWSSTGIMSSVSSSTLSSVESFISVELRSVESSDSSSSSSISPPASTAALVAHSMHRFGSSSRLSSSRQESGERRGETTSRSLGMQLDDSTSSRFSTQMLLDLLSEPSPDDLDPKKSTKVSFDSSLDLPLILLLVLAVVETELLLLLLTFAWISGLTMNQYRVY